MYEVSLEKKAKNYKLKFILCINKCTTSFILTRNTVLLWLKKKICLKMRKIKTYQELKN